MVGFICVCPSLVPHSPALLREKVVVENHINIMEGEVVRLGNILEFFNESGRIKSVRPQSLFYLSEFT